MKQFYSILSILITSVLTLSAQMTKPVHWDIQLQKTDSIVTIEAKAKVDAGWHVYGTDVPEGGPSSTTIHLEKMEGAEPTGAFEAAEGKLILHYEEAFGMQLPYFENAVTFRQQIRLTAPEYHIAGYVRFMACNDESCTPPMTEEFEFGDSVSEKSEQSEESGKSEYSANAENSKNSDSSDFWFPVIDELNALADGGAMAGNSAAHAWWYIFIAGFLGGLVALLTPCVWPMIPMTVSFFLKRTKDRRKAVSDAFTYGFSIIIIYVFLGVVVTSIFGAQKLNDLSTNAVFNIIFFLLLVVFALSFFGAFELTLPASWTTRLDEKADKTTGFLSIVFMAFTLCLVSFSCTAPIVGTLLVEAATSGSWLHPLIGMTGFALALALPFSLFSLFPSWLQNMPKSGNWLNQVKVVLGFLELALSLKFLSVADLAYGWGIMPRETFLALWIVIFGLLGFYLLGKIRLPHDEPGDGKISVTALMLAMVSLAFSVYMVPGLWGAPCKAVAAFAPPVSTQDFSLYDNNVEADFHDFDLAMTAAQQTGKPVLVDFSGYGCVNCRKMEASVWTDPEVKRLIEDHFILVSLMVDDKTELPHVLEVEENGQGTKLRTIGDKWSYLQRHKFGSNSQPQYIILNANGHPIAPSRAYDEDIEAYKDFLKQCIQ